jgi:hypothetical protein
LRYGGAVGVGPTGRQDKLQQSGVCFPDDCEGTFCHKTSARAGRGGRVGGGRDESSCRKEAEGCLSWREWLAWNTCRGVRFTRLLCLKSWVNVSVDRSPHATQSCCVDVMTGRAWWDCAALEGTRTFSHTSHLAHAAVLDRSIFDALLLSALEPSLGMFFFSCCVNVLC